LRRFAGNLALSVVVSVLLLGVLEGGARLLEKDVQSAPVAPYIWDWEEKWDGEFYSMVSRSVGWPPSEEFNGDGVRDRTHSVERLPRTSRVAILGDSVTLGAGIPAHQAYPQQLQALLDEAGRPVEIFNVALWGWSTRQQRIAYERIARPYAPELVVLGVCLNDIPELQNNLSRPPAWVASLHEGSALFRRLVDAHGREIRSVEELFETPAPGRVDAAFGRFFEELDALADDVRRDGARLAVLVFPFRFQLEPAAPEPSVQARILERCETRGLPCLDVLPALGDLGPAAFVDYDHLSPGGARRVAERLLSSGWLPETPSHPEVLAAAGRREPLTPAELSELSAAESPALREAALWTAARSGTARHLSAHAAALLGEDPDPGVRTAAAELLGGIEDADRDAEVALYSALSDPSEPVRHAAARALYRIGPSAPDVPRLTAALKSPDPYVAGFATWSLGELGPEAAEAVPALLEALRDQPLGEGIGARSLAKLGGDAASRAVPELIAALDSPERQHRFNAALALGRLGSRAAEARPALMRLLRDDPDPNVRGHAARALGRIGGEEAVEPLIAALEDGDGHVRSLAAQSLGWLGPLAAAARPRLERALTDPHRKVRRHAERALQQISPE
jgi:HEAT repeat protein/lysophospholipase L1-like esterase